jgi:hypothetical protein
LRIVVPAASKNDQDEYTHHKSIEWDSKTGIVSALVKPTPNSEEVRRPIYYSGWSLGTIPVGGISDYEIQLNGGTLEYHYWYY